MYDLKNFSETDKKQRRDFYIDGLIFTAALWIGLGGFVFALAVTQTIFVEAL